MKTKSLIYKKLLIPKKLHLLATRYFSVYESFCFVLSKRARLFTANRITQYSIFLNLITYLSSCHRTASDANLSIIRILFIAMTTSYLKEPGHV